MPNIDISRDAADPRKHYDAVWMQQGRVLTDDDFNDSERLDNEDERRVRADIIGPAGSPDAGFQAKVTAGVLTIAAGTYYVGGLRVELENDEPFDQQDDWLEQGANPGEFLTPPANERYDFLWLDVWQQPVTAVEDKELLEAALGGADTAARNRTMRRVRALEDVGDVDCPTAWGQLLTSLAPFGTIDGNFELVPDATLFVEPDGTTNPDDLCSPSIAGGYLGAENQAIRVQVTGNNEFTWGFDNGAPLYRVKLLADDTGALRRIHMLTLPKDQAHYPLEGQIVELLPWSALLPNGQKVAELSGFLSSVSGGYNPDTQDLFIANAPGNDNGAPPDPFGERWADRPDAAAIANEPAPEDTYFYMRVWNRGADTTSDPSIAFVPGTPVSLAKTGLRVTFNGTQFPQNDFWIIAVRPATPKTFVPWQLGTIGRAPHGVRRWIAPIGVIHWPGGGAPVVVDDCRPTFLPLTDIKGCCTYTVGDGTTSIGNFTSVQAAVLALPQPAGGEVCVLAGTYHENVVVHGSSIKIHGCGPRSRIEGGAGKPVFEITDSETIAIDNLAVIAANDAPGVLVDRQPVSVDIHLTRLHVEAVLMSGIEVDDCIGLTISDCDVVMGDQFTAWPAVFVVTRDGLIERNTLLAPARSNTDLNLVGAARYGFALDSSWPTALNARGGLQLGGTSAVVRVRDNLIIGGIGHGITLGSFRAVDAGNNEPDNPWVIGIDSDCEGCDPGGVIVVDPGGGGDGTTFVSAGDLREILIQQNRIYRMGLCGIGVAGFFDLTQSNEMITVIHLSILQNDIRFCLRRTLADIPQNMIDSSGFGGISLADVSDLVIDDNEIAENGRPDGGDPVCGIFVLHGEGIEIDRNHVLNNGPRPTDTNANLGVLPKIGRRGGINVVYAVEPAISVLPAKEGIAVQKGVPAARIHDNVVSAPVGQALSIAGIGNISVEGNAFTTRGVVEQPGSPQFFATTVFIFDLGVTMELLVAKYQNMSTGGLASVSDAGMAMRPRRANGNVLFVANQVKLDLLDPFSQTVSGGASGFVNLSGLQLSSILIGTLDDIGFADNQCDCLLTAGRNQPVDFVLSNAILAGFSVRMADNRMKEGIRNALASGITLGWMNATTNNQGTHCFYAYGPAGWLVDEGNRVLVSPGPDTCRKFVANHMAATDFFGQPPNG